MNFKAQKVLRIHDLLLAEYGDRLWQPSDPVASLVNTILSQNTNDVNRDRAFDTLIERDVKGLYKKALAGEIENFTGISDPYEVPQNPEVMIDSSTETVEESLAKVLGTLEELGYVPPVEQETAYSAEEEAEIEARLAALGYL
jgi:endonuclease III